MWADGLVAEAQGLGPLGVTAARAIGYAQALAQLAGELTEREAIEQAQALTRRYARRQVGWFRRYPGTCWLDADDPTRLTTAMDAIATRAAETPSAPRPAASATSPSAHIASTRAFSRCTSNSLADCKPMTLVGRQYFSSLGSPDPKG